MGTELGAKVVQRWVSRWCPGAADVGTAGGYSRRVSRRVSKHHAQVIEPRADGGAHRLRLLRLLRVGAGVLLLLDQALQRHRVWWRSTVGA